MAKSGPPVEWPRAGDALDRGSRGIWTGTALLIGLGLLAVPLHLWGDCFASEAECRAGEAVQVSQLFAFVLAVSSVAIVAVAAYQLRRPRLHAVLFAASALLLTAALLPILLRNALPTWWPSLLFLEAPAAILLAGGALRSWLPGHASRGIRER